MIKIIIKYKLKQLFSSIKCWIGLALLQFIFALIYNWLLNKYIYQLSLSKPDLAYGITEEVLHPFFAWFVLIYLLIIPIITMDQICGERNKNTLILYLTAPIKTSTIIISKFLTLSCSLTCSILLISLMPLSIIINGTIDWGHLLSLALGTWLILNAAIAIGLLVSTYGQHTVTTILCTLGLILILILIEWGALFMGPLGLNIQQLGFLYPVKNFLSGIIDTRAIIYYLVLIVVSLYLAINRLSKEINYL